MLAGGGDGKTWHGNSFRGTYGWYSVQLKATGTYMTLHRLHAQSFEARADELVPLSDSTGCIMYGFESGK